METTFQTRAKIIEASALLNQHRLYYYAKKVILLIFEIISYLSVLGLVFFIITIPSNPVQFRKELNETAYLETTLHDERISAIMLDIKLIALLFPLFVLCFGLSLGYLRRKNNRIRKAGELIDSALKTFV